MADDLALFPGLLADQGSLKSSMAALDSLYEQALRDEACCAFDERALLDASEASQLGIPSQQQKEGQQQQQQPQTGTKVCLWLQDLSNQAYAQCSLSVRDSHSFTHSLTHPPTHSCTHSLTH